MPAHLEVQLMKFPTIVQQPAEDDTPSVFAAACGAYYDSAADGIASNFGALDVEQAGSQPASTGPGFVAMLCSVARGVARALPGAAKARRERLSARFAGVVAIDRGGDR